MERKTALVTGGSRGIGKAIALELASQGHNIVVNFTSDKSEPLAQEVVAKAVELGVEGMAIQCDVSSFESTGTMVEAAMEKFGRIDILVNNAGIEKDQLMLRMSEEDFDRVIAVNLKGT